MKIQDIYDTYHIPPNLQLHMLRAAGVCKMICSNWIGDEISVDSLMQAILLHDIGNIVKFTFDEHTSKTLLGGMDIDRLKELQKEMIKKYSSNDHDANILICKEIGVSKDVIELVDAIDFLSLHYLEAKEDMEKIVINYCDLRTGPQGIITTHERLYEAAIRYKKAQRVQHKEESYALADTHENSIFQWCSIEPTEITEELIFPMIDELREYEIKI